MLKRLRIHVLLLSVSRLKPEVKILLTIPLHTATIWIVTTLLYPYTTIVEQSPAVYPYQKWFTLFCAIHFSVLYAVREFDNVARHQ